jgi:hypothetical protein
MIIMLNIVHGLKNIWYAQHLRNQVISSFWWVVVIVNFCGSEQGPVKVYLILYFVRDVVLLDHPEDESNKLLWNFGTYIQ